MQEAVLPSTGRQASISIYRWISRLRRPKSFMGKLFIICFAFTHIPLIAFCLYVTFSAGLDFQAIGGPLIVLLLATVMAFAASLVLIHHLLAPVRLVSGAMETYVKSRALPKLPLHYGDDMGLLMRNVQTALEELDFALRTTDAEANHDFLTGLGNKRWIGSRGAFALESARRRGNRFSAIVFDIDNFKQLNDNFGHAAGDTVLRAVGDRVREHLRPQDIVGRIGGEEFCILAVGCDRLEATAIAERIRLTIAEHDFGLPGGHGVTASFGIAEMSAGTASLDAVIAAADDALYDAKRAGRDRVMCAS